MIGLGKTPVEYTSGTQHLDAVKTKMDGMMGEFYDFDPSKIDFETFGEQNKDNNKNVDQVTAEKELKDEFIKTYEGFEDANDFFSKLKIVEANLRDVKRVIDAQNAIDKVK
jgi:hypothetical protein